jgi:hypothetical protein
MLMLALGAYHFGNRHVPFQIGECGIKHPSRRSDLLDKHARLTGASNGRVAELAHRSRELTGCRARLAASPC